MEKAAALKQVDNRILTLKRDINKLKDSLAEYGTYQGFLFSLSPESWRLQQVRKSSSIMEVNLLEHNLFSNCLTPKAYFWVVCLIQSWQ